jgi:hypothetical protein
VTSEITQECERLAYAILYIGEHNLIGGVTKFPTPEAFDTMARELTEAFKTADYPQSIRLIDQHFGNTSYTLKSLFKDEQRRILDEILASAREDLDSRFRMITDRYAPLMKFLQSAGAPLPAGLQVAWDLTLHSNLRKQFSNGHTDLDQLRSLVSEAAARGTEVLNADISYAVKNRMEQSIRTIAENPCDVDQIKELEGIAALMMPLPLGLNVAEVQNVFWMMKQNVLPELRQRAASDSATQDCVNELMGLGEHLGFAPGALQ